MASGLFTIASEMAQNMLRQPKTSPTAVCGPRKVRDPVASSAIEKRPEMKSSFTARRVAPCSVKRGTKPEAGKNQRLIELRNTTHGDVVAKALGKGRESAVTALQQSGLIVKAIEDVTPLPHNGCRPKKKRRV